MFGVEIDCRPLIALLTDLEKEQLPFASSLAVNKTAEIVQQELTKSIPRVFDRPNPFTMKAVRLTKPALKRGPFYRDVYIMNEAAKGTPPVKYLEPEVEGGGRRRKRFEVALQRTGVMGPSEFAVPAKGLKLNQYGNIAQGTITRILSVLKSSSDSQQNVSSKESGGEGKQARYFAPRAGSGLPLGVYERVGGRKKRKRKGKGGTEGGALYQRRARLVLLFTSTAPKYKRIWNYGEIARRIYLENYASEFKKALKVALATARR